MLEPIDRRGFLIGSTTALSLTFAGRSRRRVACARGPGIDELVERLRDAHADELFDVAARAVADGFDRGGLLAAVFLAGLSDVSPGRIGGPLHCVFMVESVFRLSEAAAADEAWILAFWALDDYRRNRDRARWSLPPAPDPLPGSLASIRAELARGLEEADAKRAERALLGLLRQTDRDACFQALRPWTYGSFEGLGHRPIYAAQAQRCLERMPERHARTALRALVLALAGGDRPEDRRLWNRAEALAHELPPDWSRNREAPAESLVIARELCAADPDSARAGVLAHLRAGLGPRTLWDALRLAAADLLLRRPEPERAFPVHTVTELEALCFAAERAADGEDAGRCLLHAAGWLAAVRAATLDNNGPYRAGPHLEDLIEETAADAAPELLEQGLTERDPASIARALSARPELASDYVAGLRRGLARAGRQDHQHKLAAATVEQAARTEPRWRPFVLAPAVDYPPAWNAATNETHERSLHVLRRVGVL